MEPKAFRWLSVLLLCACGEANPSSGTSAMGDDGADDSVPLPDYDVRHRTRHVDIAPSFTQPICRGTLDRIDHHVEMVASLLDIDVRSRPTFYWFNEHAHGATEDASCNWCTSSCNCTRANGKVIFAGAGSMLHELTHAVVIPAWGRSDIVFEEGIAHGLDGDHITWPTHERPSEVAGGRRHGGAHFSRWLVDRFGPADFRELFERLGPPSNNTKDEVFAVVESVYGMPFTDLEAEYYATASDIYPAPGLCDGLPHVPWQSDRWELHATADCDAPNVFGPRDEDAAMTIAVTLDVPEALAGVELAADVLPDHGHSGKLIPCIDEPLHDDPEPERFISGAPVANPIIFDARPGRYRLDVPLPDAGELIVRICEWNGEWRTAGEPPSLCLPD
jgi:hypothetical protein